RLGAGAAVPRLTAAARHADVRVGPGFDDEDRTGDRGRMPRQPRPWRRRRRHSHPVGSAPRQENVEANGFLVGCGAFSSSVTSEGSIRSRRPRRPDLARSTAPLSGDDPPMSATSRARSRPGPAARRERRVAMELRKPPTADTAPGNPDPSAPVFYAQGRIPGVSSTDRPDDRQKFLSELRDADYSDNQACYTRLVALLHPAGL